MGRKMVVLEGKVFTVELQSMLGSTAYGWCLKELPEGILFENMEVISSGYGVAPVIQRFYFGVSSSEKTEVELAFVMACSFQPTDTREECRVSLTIIPGNAEDFSDYSENADANANVNICDFKNSTVAYGVMPPWEYTQARMPYGMPYMQNAAGVGAMPGAYDEPFMSSMKYGYPCGMQAAKNEPFMSVKYGYPCGMQAVRNEPFMSMKYGYPCGVQAAKDEPFMSVKYGYPCGVQAAKDEPFMSVKYGYPCGVQAAKDEPFMSVKYGYPNC